MTDFDAYSLSSGLLDDFDGTVSEAWFATDAAYNDGSTVLLILDLATDDPDRPQETLKLSTGTGWVIEDSGRRIVAESGKNRSFNKSSVIGGFLQAALEAGAGETMRARGIPMEAATWQGLKFHFNRVDVVGFDGEKKERLLPTGFLGADGGAVAGGAAPAAQGSSDEVSPALRAQLTVAAKKAEDQSAFIDAAFQIDGVVDSAAAVALVTSDEFYNQARG